MPRQLVATSDIREEDVRERDIDGSSGLVWVRMFQESTDEVRIVGWVDDGPGEFGRLDAQGQFVPLPGTAVEEITHYHVGRADGEVQIAAKVAGSGWGLDPQDPSTRLKSFPDPPVETGKVLVPVARGDRGGTPSLW